MLHLLLAGALLLPGVAQQRTDTTFSAAGIDELSLDNMNGSTVVRAWDRDQIRVRATHDADDYIDIDRSGSTIDIEPDSERGAPGSVRFEIDVPARLAVRIEGINHPTQIEGVAGAIDVETVNGDIDVRGGTGDIDLETVEGRIMLTGASGRISVTSVNQGVHIANSSGEIDAETVNGPVTLTGIRSAQVSASTVNGPLSYDGALASDGAYALSSHNGDIEMHVPQGSNATFVVSTFNGEFEVEFPVQVRDREARGRFEFQVGSGGAHVELDSFGGDVRVLRTR